MQGLEEKQAAAAALLRMLQYKTLQADTRLHLLFSAIELLEAPITPPLFGPSETQELLRHMQVINSCQEVLDTCAPVKQLFQC